MSRLSLISGAETLAASFHLLIDEVLISGENTAKWEQLASLLRDAAGARSASCSHEGLLLDSLLRDEDGNARADLVTLALALESRNLSSSDRRALGDIAQLISSERAALSGRMGIW